MTVTQVGNSAVGRCTLCPGYAIVYADRALHTSHLLPAPALTPPSPTLALAGWTTKLAPDAPLAVDQSDAQDFADQAAYTQTSSPVTGFYGTGYATVIATGSPIYQVPASQNTQPVVWVSSGSDAPDDWAAGLQIKLKAVPVPTGPAGERFETYYKRALDAAGTDHQLTIIRGVEMWEFWSFTWNPAANAGKGRYECGYAGYSPDYTKGGMALPNGWGARATSLPLAAGMITQAELLAGVIAHPLEVAVPVTTGAFIPPATRSDGWPDRAVPSGDGRDAIPEGAWYRLPAAFVVDQTKPKLWQMIVTAARDYGIIVVDQTGGTVTFSIEAPNAIGTPYSPLATPAVRPDLKDGDPDNWYWGRNDVLNTFPFDKLVQLKPPA